MCEALGLSLAHTLGSGGCLAACAACATAVVMQRPGWAGRAPDCTAPRRSPGLPGSWSSSRVWAGQGAHRAVQLPEGAELAQLAASVHCQEVVWQAADQRACVPVSVPSAQEKCMKPSYKPCYKPLYKPLYKPCYVQVFVRTKGFAIPHTSDLGNRHRHRFTYTAVT